MSLHCSDKCHNTYSCSIVGYILIFSVSCIWLSLTFHISFQGTISTYPMQSESIIPKGSLYPLPCGRGLSSPFEPNEVKEMGSNGKESSRFQPWRGSKSNSLLIIEYKQRN